MKVELEKGVWLSGPDKEGDPARTLQIDNAHDFSSHADAKSALADARKYRPFENAIILRTSDDMLPVSLEAKSQGLTCDVCGHIDQLISIDIGMGGEFNICHNCVDDFKHRFEFKTDDVQVGRQENPAGIRWESNALQFPRLLAEIHAIGLTKEQYAELSESMDLELYFIDQLFDRAMSRWEAIVGNSDVG